MSLSLAHAVACLPVAWRLYLPQRWAQDPERRARAGVPAAVEFQTQPQIALEQIRQAVREGLPRGVVLADAAYGNDTAFRDALTALGRVYAVGVQGTTTVWREGEGPTPDALSAHA